MLSSTQTQSTPSGRVNDRSNFVSGLPPEIWNLVGKEIQNPLSLKMLRGMCRTFRDIFTPFYLQEYVLSQELKSELKEMELPDILNHTKFFEVHINGNAVGFEEEVEEKRAGYIVNILEKMPNLRSFLWYESESYWLPHGHIFRNSGLLDSLKSIQKLRHLSVTFAEYLDTFDERDIGPIIPMRGFKNLKSLELYNIDGDEKQLVEELASVLLDNLHLTKLGLGLSSELDQRSQSRYVVRTKGFFESLCLRYGSQKHSPPLNLRTLRLGYSVLLNSPRSAAIGNYLTKLVNLTTLECLHIYNGDVVGNDVEDGDPYLLETSWDLLEGCKLRQLEVTRLEYDVREYLNAAGRSVEELFVTSGYTMADPGLTHFDQVRLPNLTAFWASEVDPSQSSDIELSRFIDDGISTTSDDTISELGDTDEEEDAQYQASNASGNVASDSEESMEDGDDMANSASPGTLGLKTDDNDGLSYNVADFYSQKLSPSNQKFILDRLHDHGSALKVLRLSLDFDTEFTQLFAYLQRMAHLVHIRLDQKPWSESRKYPSTSLWSSAKTQVDIAHRYAQLMAVQCRSLQYIKIEFFTWQVMTPPHARPVSPLLLHEDIEGDLVLRRLEENEALSVPIFSRRAVPLEAGMSCRQYPWFFHININAVPDDVESVEGQGDTIETIAREDDEESVEVQSGMVDTVAGEAD